MPKAGLPLRSLVLTSATSLFQRQFRIFEKLTTQDGSPYEYTLASGQWSRTPEPGVPETRVFGLQDRMHSDTLWIETDNGDNPRDRARDRPGRSIRWCALSSRSRNQTASRSPTATNGPTRRATT